MSQDKPTIEVGDIMYNSWGWEQTNIDWYKVVKRTKCFAFLEPIGTVQCDEDGNPCGNGGMTGYSKPDPEVKGPSWRETLRLKVKTFQGDWKPGQEYVNPKHGAMCHWDGRPKGCTAYA